jgi:hypothetical protein
VRVVRPRSHNIYWGLERVNLGTMARVLSRLFQNCWCILGIICPMLLNSANTIIPGVFGKGQQQQPQPGYYGGYAPSQQPQRCRPPPRWMGQNDGYYY